MLPLHVKDTPLVKSRLSFAFGRPGFRWIIWILVSAAFLCMSWTLLVNFNPTSYMPSVDRLFHGRPSYYTPHTPSLPHRPTSHPTSPRAEQVRDAFIYAYSGYQKQAFPYDELLPVDGEKVNK